MRIISVGSLHLWRDPSHLHLLWRRHDVRLDRASQRLLRLHQGLFFFVCFLVTLFVALRTIPTFPDKLFMHTPNSIWPTHPNTGLSEHTLDLILGAIWPTLTLYDPRWLLNDPPNEIWPTLTQGYLSTHALDRNNMGLCFDTYWDAVSKVINNKKI